MWENKLMIHDIVSIGDKLELKKIRLSTIELDSEKTYKSQILDFIDDKTLTILMPMEKVRIIPLSVGDKYIIRFFTKKGLYQCNSIILGRSKLNNIYVLTVELTSDLEKKQRREFYRLECVLDMEYYLLSDAEISIMNKIKANNLKSDTEFENYVNALDECKREWHKGIVVDISGGGAKFVSDKLHEYGNIIHITIPFNSTIKLKNKWLKAVIASSEKLMNRQGSYEHRIQFKDMSKDDREIIIKYIFEEERKHRNKDKGV
jgi:c-di-GMP-binding flagellar brake protein YcgR